jgi:hypothetical protein
MFIESILELIKIFSIFLILMLLVFVKILVDMRKHAFLRKLAKEYNLRYLKNWQIELMRSFNSRLFKYLKTIKTEAVMEGEYKEHQFYIFRKIFLTEKGLKNIFGSKEDFTIISCEFGKTKFPHILLKSNQIPLYQKPAEKDTKIFLEEEYLKDFDLYTIEDYEIEALQIFTKKIIRSIQQISDRFSIEFGGNRIYIYLDKNAFNRRGSKDLGKLIDILKQIIDKTDGLLFRLKDDFESLDSVYVDQG